MLEVPSPKSQVYVIGAFGCNTAPVFEVLLNANVFPVKHSLLFTVNSAIGLALLGGTQISIKELKLAD